MTITPIDKFLTHSCTVVSVSYWAKNEYGNPAKTEVENVVDCFFDYPNDKLVVTVDKEDKNVEAILFTKPHIDIKKWDKVKNVLESDWSTVISSKEFFVWGIKTANDRDWVHHLEVLLYRS